MAAFRGAPMAADARGVCPRGPLFWAAALFKPRLLLYDKSSLKQHRFQISAKGRFCMTSQQTIGIIGAGALGLMHGERMAQALGRERVFLVADAPRAARYRQQGLFCNGAPCTLRVQTPGADARPVSLAIFAVKGPSLTDAIETMRPFVGAETILISLLNGITSEQALCEAFGAAHVLYAVARGTDATRVGTSVEYRNLGQILIGSRTGARTPDVEAARALLCAGGAPCVVCDDILHRQWSKLMLNVGLNQACAVYDVPYRGVQTPGAPRDTMLAAMREAQTLAAREGVTLSDEEIEAWLQMTDGLNPAGMPSMRQDTLAHRKTEVELFSGAMRRLGARHGVPTPVNDWLYERIAAIENAYPR